MNERSSALWTHQLAHFSVFENDMITQIALGAERCTTILARMTLPLGSDIMKGKFMRTAVRFILERHRTQLTFVDDTG